MRTIYFTWPSTRWTIFATIVLAFMVTNVYSSTFLSTFSMKQFIKALPTFVWTRMITFQILFAFDLTFILRILNEF